MEGRINLGRSIAWFAGFFEGEGSIIVRPGHWGSQGYWQAASYSLTIVGTDYDMIKRCQTIFPARFRAEKTQQIRLGRKQQYRWECTQMAQCRFIMAHIYPYLSERRQARWADALEIKKQDEEGLWKVA